jgi:hypothetical protein
MHSKEMPARFARRVPREVKAAIPSPLWLGAERESMPARFARRVPREVKAAILIAALQMSSMRKQLQTSSMRKRLNLECGDSFTALDLSGA